MGDALVISLHFNAGHFAHLAANYELLRELGFRPWMYVDAAFNAMDENSDFRKINSAKELSRLGQLHWSVIWGPSLRNISEIARLRLKHGSRVVYVFHEPFDSVRQYRRGGFSPARIARTFLIDLINRLVVVMSDAVITPSHSAAKRYRQSYLRLNSRFATIPLLFSDAAAASLTPEDKTCISYIGTIASDHAFTEFVHFAAAAIENGWLSGFEFLIATGSSVPQALEASLESMVNTGRLRIQSGRPMTEPEINGHFSKSLVVWNAYHRSTQSGVLPKALMFGAPVIVLERNSSEFAIAGKTAELIQNNSDVDEIHQAVLRIVANSQHYFLACRKFYRDTFDYRAATGRFAELFASVLSGQP